MKNIFLIKKINLLLAVWFSISAIKFAQQPGWIEQNLPASMTGYYYADRGDNVLIFTKSNSDIVYFFDTRINVWTEAYLGSQQNFVKVLGAGNTVFAYSDEYIIGYSSILSQWDTVKYQGNVIDPNGVSIPIRDTDVGRYWLTSLLTQTYFMCLILSWLNGKI